MKRYWTMGLGWYLGAAAVGWSQETPPPTSAPAAPASEVAANLDALTLEDLLAAARRAVERAEARGADAPEALSEATRLALAAESRSPGNMEARYIRARMMLLVNRTFEAMPILKEWSETPAGQSDAKVFQILGDLYRDTYPSLAVPKYQTAVRLNTKDVDSYVGLSKALIKLARKDEALEAARTAVSKDVSGNPGVRAQLVEALLTVGKADEAEQEAIRMVERARALAQVSLGQAAPLAALEVHQGVLIGILESRLSKATGAADDYLNLAQLRLDQSSVRHQLTYFEALTDLETGIRALGGDSPVNLAVERARLLVATHRLEEARQELQTILQAHPDNVTASEILQRIEAETQPSSSP